MLSGNGAPTPQQCDLIRLRCSVAVSAASIVIDASLPKPVLTPYTGSLPLAIAAMRDAARTMFVSKLRSRRAAVPVQ